MPQQTKLPPWTKQHDDALSGLVGLKIPKKEARKFVEVLQSDDVNKMIAQALSARTRSQSPPPAIPGGPRGAVPIHPQSQGAAPPRPTAGAPPAPSPAPPLPASRPAAAPIKKRDLFNRVADTLTGWMAPSWVGGGPLPPKPAPINLAAPTTTPTTPVAAQTGEKPRIRVPLVGKVAETAAEEPTKEKAAPLPLISSKEEYQQLAPGTEFIWKSDGHVYEKPKEEAQGKTPA
jgi:hypothetical protein